MFIACISRGRTIRQLILGSFVAPTTFSVLWLVVFGSLGIKMQRVAELALGTKADVDWTTGFVDCTALGYTAGQPTSAAAIALADEGYYALACRAHGDRIFDVLGRANKCVKYVHARHAIQHTRGIPVERERKRGIETLLRV